MLASITNAARSSINYILVEAQRISLQFVSGLQIDVRIGNSSSVPETILTASQIPITVSGINRDISPPPAFSVLPELSTADGSSTLSTVLTSISTTSERPSSTSIGTTSVSSMSDSTLVEMTSLGPLLSTALPVASSSVPFPVWGSVGLHAEFNLTPQSEADGINLQKQKRVAFRTEAGIADYNMNLGLSIQADLGLEFPEQGCRAPHLYTAHSLSGAYAGGYLNPLTNLLAPGVGNFPDMPFGIGADIQVEASIEHHYESSSAMKQCLVGAVQTSCQLAGSCMGATLGTLVLLPMQGAGAGGAIGSALSNTVLNCIPPLAADRRTYRLSVPSVSPFQLSFGMQLPNEQNLQCSIKPRAQLIFQKDILLQQTSNSNVDLEMGSRASISASTNSVGSTSSFGSTTSATSLTELIKTTSNRPKLRLRLNNMEIETVTETGL